MSQIKYYRVKLLVQLPTSSANDGDLYFVRENGELYIWDAENAVMTGIGGGGGAVASVFGRTGIVTAMASDYADVDNLLFGDSSSNAISFNTVDGVITIQANEQTVFQSAIVDMSDSTNVIIPTMSQGDDSGNAASTLYADTAVGTETTRAEAAEATLQSNITAEASTRSSADTTLQSNITAEASTRSSADTTLQSNITAEASTRSSADTTLQSNITAEASTRSSADTTLQSNITAETSRAETAEATKQATLTGTGIARNGGACTELSGDVTTSGSNAASVVKVNGAAVPVSKTVVGTNGSGQVVDASSATLSNNTSGTAANLSGTPALPNGTTATTQTALSADLKIATDAYCDSAVGVEKTRALAAEALLAPLASPALTGNPTAPTQTQADNSTKLATTAYADLAGSPSEYVSTISCFFGGISHFGLPQTASSATTGFSANKAYVALFYIPDKITVSKATLDITTPSAGSASGGIYSTSGTKLVDTGTFNTNTSGVTTNSFTPVVLTRGWYYYMVTTSTASAGFEYFSSYVPNGIGSLLNQNGVRMGTAPNTSGGAQGSSLGTVTAGSFTTLIAMLFE